MNTIAVLGASGQVGTELCLTLMGFPDVRVVAVCRSNLASALLARCGVCCRIGSMSRAADARRLLEGVNVVFDLSLPAGPEPEARRLNRLLIERAITEAPRGARYVYASTYMALGMGNPGEHFGYRRISRTPYGARKREMERTAFNAGARRGREIYILRLGQVHGEMQSVSREILAQISGRLTEVPTGPSNTIFVSTIAEALVGIAVGAEAPGLYMAVSNPQWSWHELHTHFAARAGVSPQVIAVAPAAHGGGFVSWAKASRGALLERARGVLTGYVLPKVPTVEGRVRAWHHLRTARSHLADAQLLPWRPYARAFVGDAPGRRLATPSDSRRTVQSHLVRVREALAELTR